MKESAGFVEVPIVRTHGSDGEVSVKWMTIDESAISGRDYVGGEGVIVFKDKEVAKLMRIEIINDMCPEKDECFEIKLFDPINGAKIGNVNRIAITISNDDGKDFGDLINGIFTIFLTKDYITFIVSLKHTYYLFFFKLFLLRIIFYFST